METYNLKPNYNYEITKDCIKCHATGGCIPLTEGNRHYKEYLAWLEEGNTPIPIRPSVYHELIANEWIEDTVRKETVETEQYQEALIQKKMRDIAIGNLKGEGKLPSDYKTREGAPF